MMMLLVSVAGLALAGPDSGLQPDLSNPRVKLATQLDILDGLLDAGMSGQALSMVGEMHKQGVSEVELDILEARAMHIEGLNHDAERLLLTVTRKFPRNAGGWAQLGIVLADAGRLPEAAEALKKASRLAPRDADVHNNYGYVLLASGATEASLEAFRDALAIDPASERTRNNLGFALVRLDRYDEAMETFRSAASTEADARYNFGAACEQKGDRASAIIAYESAVRAQPGHAGAGPALSRLLSEVSP
jgi:tetratricopeptide (TPR) repeat protein